MNPVAREAAKSAELTPLAQQILSHIDESSLVAMCCDIVNIPSATGHELAVAEYMRGQMEQLGLEITWQPIEDGRANVIGRLQGEGNGKCLMFNGHMDTSNTGDEPFLTGIGYKPRAVVKDGMIYGLGIYNMKGALICYLNAVKALVKAGAKLEGDVIIGAVCGEIEKTQWGKFQGKDFRGYGAGSHYLVSHGILPDMCILGEPTDMQLVLEHAGSMWVRISTHGNYVHSAFATGREEQNSIRRMHRVLADVMDWVHAWEEKGRWAGGKGFVNIGGISGGYAWRASRTPERTDLFLDVRVAPAMPMTAARKEARRFFLEIKKRYPDYGLEFETYVSVPGASIAEDHQMVRAIERNHQLVVGKPSRRSAVLWCSDASVLSRFGCDTVNYGPSSGERDAEGEKVAIQTLLDITKVYALTAAEICGAR